MGVTLKVAVIGAGLAGLVAARELKREGHQVTVFEKADQLGGTWVYNPQVESNLLSHEKTSKTVHSSLYFSLRTNLPRQLMGFSDYPFKVQENGDPRNFPGHEEVLRFLKDFANEFGIVELIRFKTEVVRVEPVELERGEWIVESRTGEDQFVSELFEAVVVCNGHYTVPHVEHLSGIEQWPGKQVHSHNYREPTPYQNQVVVVIGSGPSATDISAEIANVAKEVHLSSRSPDIIKVSKLETHHNIWQHSKILEVCEDGRVQFGDGSSVLADTILHCTGYNYSFPFLKKMEVVRIDDRRVGPLYKHVFPPSLSPRLSFVGIPLRVQTSNFERLCHREAITTVNGQLPGPTVVANEGDKLVVRVVNSSPYNMTIHWHGVKQLFSAWADGPEYVTQCPIQPGKSFTHRFKVTGQEGTVFWHAHARWLRATVYGAIIIRPKSGKYPFPTPYGEVPIILGEWWNAKIIDIEDQAIASGGGANVSDALLINGQPGDLYPCSKNSTYKLNVVQGKTYLIRIVNAALDTNLFFKIADHKLTVVGTDASYTVPKQTDVLFLAPGQTIDALLTADQKPASYYMAARGYKSAPSSSMDMTTTTGIITYTNCKSTTTPKMPNLPAYNDTQTVTEFSSSLLGLTNGPHWTPPPLKIDEHMFMTLSLGLAPCGGNSTCSGPVGMRFRASLNNESFVAPTKISMLEAFYKKISGIYTTDFPNNPPMPFDYTSTANSANIPLLFPSVSTKVKKLKFNSTVEIVMQNTALLQAENHPMHLHGFDFHVLGYGFGNYNAGTAKLNTVNPQMRNTVSVPVGGWAVIRFQANNPGLWLMHCHLDLHVPWGMSMAFQVENGPTTATSLPPPPSDLPKC